ncbi:MAG: homoserine kinase [Desulfurococcaceae archaeon]|nr:homoserine kinase [Desulfurococcaceae archaeon]
MAVAVARAYMSSANLGSGFDVVAVALDSYWDSVKVKVSEGSGNIVLTEVNGPFSSHVPRGSNNIVVRALELALKAFNIEGVDVEVKLWKGIPVSSGLGGSGASAVAAIAALIGALRTPLDRLMIAGIAGLAEASVAGEPHFDNVTASSLGGLVLLLSSKPPILAKRLGVKDLSFVVSTPIVKPIEGKTGLMRKVIPRTLDLSVHIESSARLSALLYGLAFGDVEALSRGLEDVVVEPARSKYIPCYDIVKSYARRGGAIGSVISGAGPSMLSITTSKDKALEVASWVERAYRDCGVDAVVKVADVAPGVEVEVGGDG